MPLGAIIAAIIVLYAVINVLAVKYYGETEFWAALGKVILIIALIIFTFVVMLGGNPKGDRFGFRYWHTPGAFTTMYYEGPLGCFLGFLQCMILASFTNSGPEYVSMAAGEAGNPRKSMPRAFNATFYRLTTFFMLGALCLGILVPYNDSEMAAAFISAAPGAAASPYVVAMNRLNIKILPSIVNGAVFLLALSAGNSLFYCASRSLYGLALGGKVPKLFIKCSKSGVPIYAVALVSIISLISLLQLSASTAQVLNWFIALVTASLLMNYSCIALSYICFYRVLKVQGIDRQSLPYTAWFMPYAAYYALAGTVFMTLAGGYAVFLKDNWDTATFFFSYVSLRSSVT